MTNRWKNYGLWVSIFAFIALFIQALGVYGVNLILPGNYNSLVTCILGILVLAGIINDPTTTNLGFLGDHFILIETFLSQWKNYKLWVAIFAFIPLFLQGLDVYNIHVLLPGNYGDIVNSILGILVLAGVLVVPPIQDTIIK
jgi:phi LC3 family holin